MEGVEAADVKKACCCCRHARRAARATIVSFLGARVAFLGVPGVFPPADQWDSGSRLSSLESWCVSSEAKSHSCGIAA